MSKTWMYLNYHDPMHSLAGIHVGFLIEAVGSEADPSRSARKLLGVRWR